MSTFTTHPTPNPNSLKITTDAGPFIEESMAAFGSADEAEAHPLGRRLFAVTGVADVFITPDFLTVTKRASGQWDLILPKVNEVLGEHFEKRQ